MRVRLRWNSLIVRKVSLSLALVEDKWLRHAVELLLTVLPVAFGSQGDLSGGDRSKIALIYMLTVWAARR